MFRLEGGSDKLHFRFNTRPQNGQELPAGINITEETHPLMPAVYNLSFGPVDELNEIDEARVYHENYRP